MKTVERDFAQTTHPGIESRSAMLELRGVGKSYRAGKQQVPVLDGIDLSIREGEFIAIVGFSGSGKTTLISLMAGLLAPDRGEILRQGEPITGPGPDRGVVFQSYSLMPWLNVEDNIALAVDQLFKHWPKDRRSARVDHYLRLVNLAAARDKRPAQLSGGMRQRVNVARALAADPDILLLDEPLSALDALTRAKLQDEILKLWEQEKKTVALITNDVDEAIYMADRVIALNPGPNATLGPVFEVTLPRPRDRAALNHDEDFKQLRVDITRYLMAVGQQKKGALNLDAVTLPDVRPNTSIDWKLDTAALKPPRSDLGRPRYLEFSKVSKSYPAPSGKGQVKVVDGFDLLVNKGEFIAIIGHSGCGKSTVLSMTAGLTGVSEGGIVLDNREVDSAGPDKGVVFQAPSLFSWLTASENVMLGVEKVYPHASPAERRDIADYYLARVGLADAMDKKAADLSGGMRQRVGIARAFALSPKLLLLDEPFGMLDALTRWELQEVLMEVWQRSQVTAVMVTHDVDEAILLADRVVMMTNGPHAKVGKIEQIALPRPRSRKALIDHPDYYRHRESLLTFLNECEHTH